MCPIRSRWSRTWSSNSTRAKTWRISNRSEKAALRSGLFLCPACGLQSCECILGMTMKRVGLVAVLSLFWASAAFADTLAEIRSGAALDEPRGYCVDMVGSQARASIDRPLQAHTCYAYQGRIAVDQGVSREGAGRGLLRFTQFGVCLAGPSARAGGPVTLTPCSAASAAMVAFDGPRITPAGQSGLCLTIAGGASRSGNGGIPTHLIRGLTWETCGDDVAERQSWALRP
jgi:hypothetical protein